MQKEKTLSFGKKQWGLETSEHVWNRNVIIPHSLFEQNNLRKVDCGFKPPDLLNIAHIL